MRRRQHVEKWAEPDDSFFRETFVYDHGKAVARQARDLQQMNSLERIYAGHLEGLLHKGLILAWEYEPIRLRLAEKTFYTPDFLVIGKEGQVAFEEVKGYWEEDARVKIKVAARLYPWFYFAAVTRENRQWKWEYFGGSGDVVGSKITQSREEVIHAT